MSCQIDIYTHSEPESRPRKKVLKPPIRTDPISLGWLVVHVGLLIITMIYWASTFLHNELNKINVGAVRIELTTSGL